MTFLEFFLLVVVFLALSQMGLPLILPKQFKPFWLFRKDNNVKEDVEEVVVPKKAESKVVDLMERSNSQVKETSDLDKK